MQSVTSNAVAQQLKLEGFIKSYEVDYGNLTVSTNNYISLGNILENKTIIGHTIRYWGSNSGVFNIEIYHPISGRNTPHLIANNGVTVTSLQVTYYYID